MAASCTASARTASSVATPTGSTAYSPVGGGAILTPNSTPSRWCPCSPHPEQPPHRAGCGQRSAAAGLARQPGRRHAGELRRPGHPGGPPGDGSSSKEQPQSCIWCIRWITATSTCCATSSVGAANSSSQATPVAGSPSLLSTNRGGAGSKCRLPVSPRFLHPVHGLASALVSISARSASALAHTTPMLTVTPRTAGRPLPGIPSLSGGGSGHRCRGPSGRSRPHDDGELLAADAPHRIILAYLGHQHPGHSE